MRLIAPRSGYIATVLARMAQHQRDRTISAKVNAVLDALDEQDLDTAQLLLAARRNEGTEW